MSRPQEFDNFPQALVCTYGPYMAVVETIIDGDTFYALVDPGFHQYTFAVIRIRGINAPELFTGTERAAGSAAKDGLNLLMKPGTAIKLTTERDVTTFGRFVADVTLEDGSDVGAEMIRLGYAAPMPR
jgi:endonuclease YncB( thermonuclease family)